MRVRTFASLVVFLLAPFAAGSAYADSDGYYCIGAGYLAYQFGFAAPSMRPHRLHVMPVGGPGVIAEPVVLELPQFQVHGMQCGQRGIQLVAFDAVYTVALDPDMRPTGFSIAPLTEGRFPAELTGRQLNLGAWSKPVGTHKVERVAVAKGPNGNEILLEISPRAAAERCVTDITTRVIEVDASGLVLRQWTIFVGKGRRECGEAA